MAELASDRVYAHLKDQIILGQIVGNALLSEGEIAEQLGVSRTPVREAFLRLQAEGWMRLYPKRGALVLGIDPREGVEILQARTLIEDWAARRISALPDARAHLLEELRATLEQQSEALTGEPDMPAFTVADLHFHQLIVAAADNSILTAVYQQLSDRQRRMTSQAVVGLDKAHRVLAHHHKLLEALESASPDEFAAVLQQHFAEIHHTDTTH
ncbi:GntR family transcriptional regulator [Pseudoclavibacter soli]|uniref:GntR family transcriptional regulator n=1 Tax=Pseudoclavibacter soli TaxID=452623 RepID=UPI0004069E27|nr:GntR family transcriptional regulator [Pseudoclavibacter soli]